jgi:nicotinate-nucleotide adenylyltransferase
LFLQNGAELKQPPAAPVSAAQALPPHSGRMRIGLLGGSFNPPHQAHRAIIKL